MTDYLGMAALVTAALGGLATLVIGIATLIATLRGNESIALTNQAINGRLDKLVSEATTRAYLQGVREGERRHGMGTKEPFEPGPIPPTVPFKEKDFDEHND